MRARRPLAPRDPDEPHRASSPLELLFDLVFVVAVSRASGALHTAEADQAVASGLAAYLLVFFAIWWAWMGFSWFASAYDSDDVGYRLLTLVQMAGALLVAAGAAEVVTDQELTRVVAGYVVMRVALVVQWLRAAAGDPPRAAACRRYAAGIAALQVLWVAQLALPAVARGPVVLALVAAEVAVPVWAERTVATPWHPGHIAERYGCFTLIVMGETVLAATTSILGALDTGDHVGSLFVLAGCALVLVASMWWTYFDSPQDHLLTDLGAALRWGYGHYVVFASAAAVSAGVAVALDRDTGATGLGAAGAAATVTVPVAAFLLAVWALVLRNRRDPVVDRAVPALAVAVGASAFAPASLVVAAVLAAATAAVVTARRAPRRALSLRPSPEEAPA